MTRRTTQSEREREIEMKRLEGEVVLKIPAEKAWEMYRDDEIISKINPEMLALAQYVEGDGSPGSLRLFKLGPGLSLSLSLYSLTLTLYLSNLIEKKITINNLMRNLLAIDQSCIGLSFFFLKFILF